MQYDGAPAHIARWEEDDHKCKNNISGTLAINTLKGAKGNWDFQISDLVKNLDATGI